MPQTYSQTYNGTTYYYILNLQGDVMYMVDASGTAVATYEYDPYGKVLTATGTMADINPLRYRGYYYDIESGFYYLQSRYYDPAIGRFFCPDAYASTGQGILGYNMFAYCNNNPIIYSDPSGAAAYISFGNNVDMLDEPWKETYGGGGYAIPYHGTQTSKKIIPDYTKNTSIAVVLAAESYAYYNGALVIKFTHEDISSFAIGNTIFLNRSQNTEKTILHEYGHILQEREYGTAKYVGIVFLPSVSYNVASRILPSLNDNYYNMPWEYDADMRGGIRRDSHKPYAEPVRDAYFDIVG